MLGLRLGIELSRTTRQLAVKSKALQWLFGIAPTGTTAPDKHNKGTARAIERGRANTFDGVDDKITIPHSSVLTFGDGVTDQPFSISAWVNMTDTTTFKGIFSKEAVTDFEYALYTNGADEINFIIAESNTVFIGRKTATILTEEGNNIFIVSTYDGSGLVGGVGISVYGTSGALLFSDTTDVTGGSFTAMSGDSFEQHIGWNENVAIVTAYADGVIWDVRVHNTELTTVEIQALVDDPNSLTGHEVGHWKLDEQAGTIALDSTTNENHGDLAGGVTHTTQDVVSFQNEEGYTLSDGATYYREAALTNLIANGAYIPKVIGLNKCAAYVTGGVRGALQFSGVVPKNGVLVESHCATLDGVDDEINYGDCGSTTKISIRVKSILDNQYILSLDNAATKAVNVIAGVLTFGASLTESNINIDGVSKTAAQAGALLNDNLDHLLAFDLVSVTAPDMRLGRSALNYGNIRVYDFVMDELSSAVAEGGGLTIFDNSVNNNHGTATGMTSTELWANTQDVFHANIILGFELYDDDATHLIEIKVSFKSDGSKITPTISGYSKIADHPAGAWHNEAETKWKPNPGDDPRLIYQDGLTSLTIREDTDVFVSPEYMNQVDVKKVKDYLAYMNTLTAGEKTEIENFTT